MAAKIVFYDEKGNELDCYLSNSDQLYISIHDGTQNGNGIGLDKEDAEKLIQVLNTIVEKMK
jgi:hypothetical protein